jgi:competence protein ComEA
MFFLTKSERKALLAIVVIVFLGSVIKLVYNPQVSAQEFTEEKVQQIININTALSTELESIPGIGQVTATRIIDYRNQHGKFSSIQDLKQVKGIGDKKAETISQHITF